MKRSELKVGTVYRYQRGRDAGFAEVRDADVRKTYGGPGNPVEVLFVTPTDDGWEPATTWDGQPRNATTINARFLTEEATPEVLAEIAQREADAEAHKRRMEEYREANTALRLSLIPRLEEFGSEFNISPGYISDYASGSKIELPMTFVEKLLEAAGV